MISNADLDPNCLMKIFDNQDGTNSRPKISGWNLTYHRDNLAHRVGCKIGCKHEQRTKLQFNCDYVGSSLYKYTN